MPGCQLRMNFDNMTEEEKYNIRVLCEKYNVKPECSFSGRSDIMTFVFDNLLIKDGFTAELSVIVGVPDCGIKRRVFGHRVECPL